MQYKKYFSIKSTAGRDSVTETIPPIVATKTLNVFNAEEAKVKRVG